MQSKLITSLLLLLLISLFISGCGSISSQSQLMKEAEVENVSRIELRNRLTNFTVYFAKIVESAADEIIAKSNDPEIKMNALRWKINSIPTSQYALFLNDPMAALIDIATFCIQMNLFFSKGNGKDIFGEFSYIARDASGKIMDELHIIWNRVSTSMEDRLNTNRPVYKWAQNHPIDDLSFTRRSVGDTLMTLYKIEEVGLQETVGNIAAGIFDIRERLSIYTDLLPRQARWQAEYMINERLDDQNIEETFNNLTRITNSIDTITQIIEKSPELVTDLQISTLNTLRKERQIILTAISAERIAILNEIDRQRIKTIDDLITLSEALSSQVLEDINRRGYNLIDHFFWRLLQFFALVLVVAFIVFFIIRKILQT